jgi:hypothetical protein
MTRPAPTITCLFYSDASVASFLATPSGRACAGDILVECSARPALGFALGVETPVNYPGIAGLLGGADLGALAHAADRLPAPIVLAPGTVAAVPALRTSLAHLRRPDDRISAVTLLVAIADAIDLGAALAVADRFAIAWDVAAFPHRELVTFAQWLAAERLFTAENFIGLYPYGGEPIDTSHTERLQALLAPVSARVPAIAARIG